VIRALLVSVLAAAVLVAAPALAAKKSLAPGERIDLNRASAAELMRLPGVGEKRAQAIVAQRAKQPFRRPEDVLSVKGLGPAWFAKVKANLAAGVAQPVAARPPARR
jgi:competence protein ComEA